MTNAGGSASIGLDEYWWYTARGELLHQVLAEFVTPHARVLDVGSADGPSVEWLRQHDGLHVTLDIDPRGLTGTAVCGSAMALPFADGSFDVVGAFDVVEHCAPESLALAEIRRVLRPGGHLLMSVPAYEWAWSDFDEANGHHRRYTRPRAVAAVEAAGLQTRRATYAFGAVFPFFAAERLLRRVLGAARRSDTGAADIVEVPTLPTWLGDLLVRLSRLDRRILRRRDLPFGSSVFIAARRPD